MYDIKTNLQFDQKIKSIQQQQQQNSQETTTNNILQENLPYSSKNSSNPVISTRTTQSTTTTQTTNPGEANNRRDLFIAPHLTSAYSTCSIIKLSDNSPLKPSSREDGDSVLSNPADTTHMTLLSLRRRRWLLQRHACLFSILLAFVFGLAVGVFMPLFGWANILQSLADGTNSVTASSHSQLTDNGGMIMPKLSGYPATNRTAPRPPSDFPTIYELQNEISSSTGSENSFSVAFIKEEAAAAASVQLHGLDHKMNTAHSPQEERQLNAEANFVPLNAKISTPSNAETNRKNGFIKSNIYWGEEVERLLPRGFTPQDSQSWNQYVNERGVVERLETGCGRMQNRLVIFADGTRACARYRQNTDQIQGELFSFYLGQLLNLTNLAPSAAAVIDLNSSTWNGALTDITQAQWKQQRPVVLTRWLPELEPAGIPQQFQPMERHLNKYDVWNMTQQTTSSESPQSYKQSAAEANELAPAKLSDKLEKGLYKRLGTANSKSFDHQSLNGAIAEAANEPETTIEESLGSKLLRQRLIELAQWSDLIVFDYLIANLDRVVNNLYNFQWNADIMAAPAHNLARQTHSQLLVFLDNESGLLHGYRLLKKYEAYHGLLLDNLCVFRQPTIDALREVREQGVGRRIREIFQRTTTNAVRDVLPSLPDKSIKILVDRIDRVLGQVQKCRDLLADR